MSEATDSATYFRLATKTKLHGGGILALYECPMEVSLHSMSAPLVDIVNDVSNTDDDDVAWRDIQTSNI